MCCDGGLFRFGNRAWTNGIICIVFGGQRTTPAATDKHVLLAGRMERTIGRRGMETCLWTTATSNIRAIPTVPNCTHAPTYPPYHRSFFDSAAPATSASEPITCPYSFTRLGSTRYIHRYHSHESLHPSDIHVASHLIQEDEKHDVVPVVICRQRHPTCIHSGIQFLPETGQTVQERHFDTEPMNISISNQPLR